MKSVIMGIESSLECTINQRLNRFVVEILVDGGLQRACINNTGRLEEYLFNGKTGFCIRNERPLKTAYRLFAIREGDLGAIIDTQLQMRALEKALVMGLIPWLDRCVILKRNARLGNSVIDYLLGCGESQAYLEVKSAVLREGHYAMYPDCPSARGRKHIMELMTHRLAGGTSTTLFIAALPGMKVFKPNWMSDPELCDLLTKARGIGVEIKAMAVFYNPRDSLVYLYHPDLPVRL